jgi:alpha-galactosidase
MIAIALRGMALRVETALVDGIPADAEIDHVEANGAHHLTVHSPGSGPLSSVGLRLIVEGVGRYLRNGYHSWDGSWFTTPGTPDVEGEEPGRQPSLGFAMTALLPATGTGAVVLGFDRHDRFQTRFRFGGTLDRLTIDIETLLDMTGARDGETLTIFDDADVETALRRWSEHVADASPLPPRVPDKRITGWCSWYNLYATITDENIAEHLNAASAFRDTEDVPLDVFLIDDGFTPEMGDWLDVKPQFPRGMKPLLADIAGAGFMPGLWIAPFLVGNRSKLYAAHPDWVVGDRVDGGPLVAMRFYGEFRWHKRSEEYYILDITHPQAEAYIAEVFRTWAHDWGARYFKTDFMYYAMDHGPDRAIWNTPGLSRVEVWRKMAALIRREIGDDALWLGCGAPLWASVGYVDANRIGRDIGVRMTGGGQSAESLIRDRATRTHANNKLWQADPDCILLRDRFHDLTDEQVEQLARVGADTGGVLMTSDDLGVLSAGRRKLFAKILAAAR